MTELENRLEPLISKIEKMRSHARRTVVAIDGRCGAGKSSAAEILSQVFSSPVVHTDDFFLPQDKRTAERLNEPGGNIDYERFIGEVISKLNNKADFEYGKFDCHVGEIVKKIRVPYTDVIIVEGAYSMHEKYGNYFDVSAFFDVSPDIQLERIKARGGESVLEIFKNKWIPSEEAYFAAQAPQSRADFVIK